MDRRLGNMPSAPWQSSVGCGTSLKPQELPSGSLLLNMFIEIVDCPIKNGGSFHSCVSHYQRVPEGQKDSETKA